MASTKYLRLKVISTSMAPFSKENQLCRDLESTPGAQTPVSLPGQPLVLLNDPDCAHIGQFLKKDICSHDLETMAPHLWIMTTFSSANINPLHRQKVKGRNIIITEEPRLHLVWIYNRIFIKPLPRYLLCHIFWEKYLDSDYLGPSRGDVWKAATGFLRTYRYLIRHESDFHIAREQRLIPKDVDWPSFCRFIVEFENIKDSTVSGRYSYGELRLTRLNFYAPLLLHKFYFEQVHGQYSEFFNRLFGPILFGFGLASTVLSAMQVALAAEQLQLAAVHWESVLYVSRWFSVVSLIGAAIISTWFILLWLWLFLDEWIYTLRRKIKKRQESRRESSC